MYLRKTEKRMKERKKERNEKERKKERNKQTVHALCLYASFEISESVYLVDVVPEVIKLFSCLTQLSMNS